jgi:tetraacyldisaccharide 4'-kinase
MKRGWPERWREPGPWSLLLLPLSWAYGLLSGALRRWRGRRPPAKVPGLRVISVGNLSVGGTGKSALVRTLAKGALKRRLRSAVLLRGYGALEGPRPLWVSRGRRPLVDAAHSGDEAQEHARVAGLGVLIDPDRLRGAREAAAQGYECLILDDGFQRRWQLERDADVLMASWPEIQAGERLLPAGPWREPWKEALGARALLLQEAPGQGPLPPPWGSLPLLKVGYQPQRLWQWKAGALSHGPRLSRLRRLKVLALSGLGQPRRFEASLESLGAELRVARFPDHHAYGLRELQALPLAGLGAICTTMKDALRLPRDWEPGPPVWVLEADLKSQPAQALGHLVADLLD